MSERKFNSELAHQVLDQIEAHPESWNQSDWSCGTAHCFAGWNAWLANGPFEVEQMQKIEHVGGPSYLRKITRKEKTIPVRVDVRNEAANALGIEAYHLGKDGKLLVKPIPLFHPYNTLEDLKRIVAELEAS